MGGIIYGRRKSSEIPQVGTWPLNKEDLIELGKKLAEIAVLQLKGISKEDVKRVVKEIEKICKKMKKGDKKIYKESEKAIKLFVKTGKTDGLVSLLKTVKEKYV